MGGADNLIDPSNLRKLIKRNIPFANLEDAPIPVPVVATNLGGAAVCLSSGPAVGALLASAANSYSVPVGSNNIISLIRTYALLSSLAKLRVRRRSANPQKLAWHGPRPTALRSVVRSSRLKFVQRAKKGETPYAIAKALGIDRHTAAKYAHLLA